MNNLAKLGINGLMTVLLLALLAMPLSALGLAGIAPDHSAVLSAQDKRDCECPKCMGHINPKTACEICREMTEGSMAPGNNHNACNK